MSYLKKVDHVFGVVAREWFAKHEPNWSANHANRIIRRLERDIFPWVGGKAIADITAPQLLEAVRRIEQRGALETAHCALGSCGKRSTMPLLPDALDGYEGTLPGPSSILCAPMNYAMHNGKILIWTMPNGDT